MGVIAEEVGSRASQGSQNQSNRFEERWAKPDLSAGSLRNWLVKKERFFLTRLKGGQGRVLDLGCGGGWRLFTKIGSVVGVDVSWRSLKAASGIYNGAVQASLAALPFADESFDYVVSLDVLGHIPVEEKDLVLREILRVMKIGGHTLHYIETEGDDPLTRFAKAYPQLYQRHILEPEGHLGLEPAWRAMERFRSLGFRPIGGEPVYRMLLHVNRVVQYFDNEYKKMSRRLALLVALCKLALVFWPVAALANLAVAMALEVTDRLFPTVWSSGVLVEYQKQG